jgi:hypothetical protein
MFTNLLQLSVIIVNEQTFGVWNSLEHVNEHIHKLVSYDYHVVS